MYVVINSLVGRGQLLPAGNDLFFVVLFMVFNLQLGHGIPNLDP